MLKGKRKNNYLNEIKKLSVKSNVSIKKMYS